jgi:hypothetical protein
MSTRDGGGWVPAVTVSRRSGSDTPRALMSAATACQIVGTAALNVARSAMSRSTNAVGSNPPP